MTPLELFKEHLKIEHNDDDIVLKNVLEAARLQACGYCAVSFVWENLLNDATLTVIDDAVKHAIFMLASSFYDQRAIQSKGNNFTTEVFERLLLSYRVLSV